MRGTYHAPGPTLPATPPTIAANMHTPLLARLRALLVPALALLGTIALVGCAAGP